MDRPNVLKEEDLSNSHHITPIKLSTEETEKTFLLNEKIDIEIEFEINMKKKNKRLHACKCMRCNGPFIRKSEIYCEPCYKRVHLEMCHPDTMKCNCDLLNKEDKVYK